MTTRQQDPYYEIRPILDSAVNKLAAEIQKQQSPLDRDAKGNYQSKIRKLKKSNAQLRSAIKAVKLRKGDARYRHIDDQEIASRNRFVDNLSVRLQELEASLAGEESKHTAIAPESTSNVEQKSIYNRHLGRNNQFGEATAHESQFQSSLAQQNDDIEYISDKVSEINEHARAIGEEYTSQAG